MEGNSPVSTGTYSTSSTNMPDAEDINRDGNMDIYENYYQYHVDINPNKMTVGQNYIVDKVVGNVKVPDGSTKSVTWYQFRIPISVPEQVVGTIQDFRSISYMRMMMKGFQNQMVLRFARLELTRGEWRKYQYTLFTPSELIDPPIPGDTQFDIGAVNTDENSGRTPINYVVPPGIEQETNTTSPNLQQLNEQSMSYRICNLQDGDARAAYKNAVIDMRVYKHLRYMVHCEPGSNGTPLKDNDLTVFIRLGSDFNQNYYEYEMPLKVSQWYNNDPNAVWPEGNNLDITLEDLTNAKLERSKSNWPVNQLFATSTSSGTIYIMGSPNLATVKTVMIGIRNPKKNGQVAYNNDDGLPKCTEVWINELRMTDFDQKGGYAAIGRVTTKLANLGTLSLAGSIKSIGFGGIEQKVSERSMEQVSVFDVSTTLELGKFFPEKSGVSIPFYFSYGETVSNPQYNPLDPDILFSQALKSLETKAQRDSLKRRSQDYATRRSFNFTNVRLNKMNPGKSHIYDISNFNVSYIYTEFYHRNITYEYDVLRTHKAVLNYNFNANPKNYMPFKKMGGNSKWLRIIKDFNVTPLPSSLNASIGLDRTYGETLLRNNSSYQALIDTTFNKIFTMYRSWGLKWDLTKSIKMNFDAMNQSRVDEPNGRIDNKEKQKIVQDNAWGLGRNTNYQHNGDITYQVPLNKIPLLDWTSLNAKYGFTYSWLTAPLDRKSTRLNSSHRT